MEIGKDNREKFKAFHIFFVFSTLFFIFERLYIYHNEKDNFNIIYDCFRRRKHLSSKTKYQLALWRMESVRNKRRAKLKQETDDGIQHKRTSHFWERRVQHFLCSYTQCQWQKNFVWTNRSNKNVVSRRRQLRIYEICF